MPSLSGRSIKWIDLSTHRSGLPKHPGNLSKSDSKNPYRKYNSKKAASFLHEYQLPRQPGDAHEYSYLGASVLGYLVAQKAGTSYQELLRERIAKPLRMTDCTVPLSSDQRKRLAIPHDNFGSPTALWTCADLPGACGIHATMRDMMRFAKAQLTPPGGKLDEAIELAWKQHSAADASGPALGLGWVIAGDGPTRWHNGETGGPHLAIFNNRPLHCAVVVLCNTAAENTIEQLATRLVQKVAGQDADPLPTERPAPALGSDSLAFENRHERPSRQYTNHWSRRPSSHDTSRPLPLRNGAHARPARQRYVAHRCQLSAFAHS